MRMSIRVLAAAFCACILVAAASSIAFAEGIPVKPAGVSPEKFEPSTACGCHASLVEQWSKTLHAKALTDPLYLYKVEQGDKATDGKLGPFCKQCHGPAATITGEIAAGKKELSAGTAEGVNCSFCHQVIRLADGRPFNTSMFVDPSGVRRAQLKDPQAPHKAAYSEPHEKAEFCGSCHNVDSPVNGMHLEATYTEWKEGPYAAEGIVCQDCHMSRQPGVVGPSTGQAAGGAPERDNIYQMSFMGANVGQGNAEFATAMLQKAAEMELEAPEILDESRSGKVKVTITNVGAGHYLPTGLTDVRQMWLAVTATGADGRTVEVGEHRFGTILEDEQGNAPADLWDASAIKSDDRIPPRESYTEEFDVVLPEGSDSATVKAALYYQSAPDEMAKAANVPNPTTEMVAAETGIYASEAAKQAAIVDSAIEEQPESNSGSMVFWYFLAAVAAAAGIWLIVSLARPKKQA